MRLRWRGSMRRFGRGLKTVRGALQFAFILLMSGWGLGSVAFMFWMSSSNPQAAALMTDKMRNIGAVGFFMLTTWTMLFSTGDSAIYFTASEVAFLFPAPFHRRQLLTYKLLQGLGGIVILSVMFSLMMARSVGLWSSAFIGIMLTLGFLQLLTMNVAFLRQILEARVNTVLRRVIGYAILALLLTAVSQTVLLAPAATLDAVATALRSTLSGRLLLAPFDTFVQMIIPRDFSAFLTATGLVFSLDVLLLISAYRMDGLSLEAAVAVSEKLTERMKKIQTRGAWQIFGSATSKSAGRRIPRLPFWYGAGPIIWQRMTTNIRTSTKLFAMLGGAVLIAGGFAFSMHRRSPSEPFAAAGAAIGIMNYVSLLVCLSQQNEIERVGYLKSLPLRGTAIVLGELLGFVAILSMVQGSFFLLLCGLLPSISGWLVCAACLTLPLNFMLFAVDKLVFYLFPTRMAKGAPGDFQNSGKQMFFMMMKMLGLFVATLFVGLGAIPGAIMESPVLAVSIAAIVLVAECLGVVPLMAYAFNRFDPSTDTPA